jgi:hypothetical protein
VIRSSRPLHRFDHETEDEHLERLQQYLGDDLNRWLTATVRYFDNQTLRALYELVHRKAEAMRREVRYFPRLVPIVLPSVGFVQLVRRDLETQGIENTIINLARTFPALDPRELAQAIKKAFPEYRPSEVHRAKTIEFDLGDGAFKYKTV